MMAIQRPISKVSLSPISAQGIKRSLTLTGAVHVTAGFFIQTATPKGN